MSKPTTGHRDLMKRALRRLEEADARLQALQAQRCESIAVIGLGCRFPGGADTSQTYWDLLREGRDAICEVPPARWDVDELYDPDPETPGCAYTRLGGFLRQVDGFDAAFFGISNREAVSMDPQQRLLLEVAWETLENAGIPANSVAEADVGVFVGLCSNDYGQLLAQRPRAEIDAYVATGNSHSVAAGRLAFWLGCTGPAMSVDTACSSSLVSVHLACQSLRNRECQMALAGGVNLMLTPDLTIDFCKARMLSPTGRCKTFDAAADGFSRGEGCGIVALKRLTDAQAAGDQILALIRGSAVNQDGRTSGLTVPRGPSQQAVIRRALQDARLSPGDVQYVEAHGTGTALGDPIEVGALSAVFADTHSLDQPLLIGSVKTNLGHLEGAAGVASLIKVVLALHHRHLPPHLHFQTPSPRIDWQQDRIRVCSVGRDWTDSRRVAGVSSFGFSGTNAHVVLEQAPPAADLGCSHRSASPERDVHLLNLSAKSEAALAELAQRYESFLDQAASWTLFEICHTAAVRRTALPYRLTVMGRTPGQVSAKLAAWRGGQPKPAVYRSNPQRRAGTLGFLFTGQGSQYAGMGQKLFAGEPVFSRALCQCQELLSNQLPRPLLQVILEDELLNQTEYTQPVLFALEYALVQLWESWGVRPTWVLGHSLGEYVAACIAGAVSLEDALKLVAARGRLMQVLPQGGKMAAVRAGQASIAPLLQDFAADVAIAAVNGPEETVISGRMESVDRVLAELSQRGLDSQTLAVSHGFHSPLIEPMLNEFDRALAEVEFRPLQIPLVSNVTGQIAPAGSILDAPYWRRHTRNAVRFLDGVRALFDADCRIFLEIGPKPVLTGLGRRCLPGGDPLWASSLAPERDDYETILEAVAQLHTHGVNVDWSRLYPRTGVRLAPVPTYPFQRRATWFKALSARVDQSERHAMSSPSLEQPRSTPSAADETAILLDQLRALTARLLRATPEELDIHAPFLEMGADSLVLMEAIRTIEKTFGVTIRIRQLFETHTNVADLAVYLQQNLPADRRAALFPAAAIKTTPTASEPLPLTEVALGSALPFAAAPPLAATNPAGSLAALLQQQLQTFQELVGQQLTLLGSGSPAPLAARPDAVAPKPTDPPRPVREAASGNGETSVLARAFGNGQVESKTAVAATDALPPWKINEVRGRGLTPQQEAHLEQLIARYTAKTPTSKQLMQHYRRRLADNRASAGFRYSTKEMLYPITAERSRGSRIWDVDGNEYIDITMGFGVNLFGHHPDFIVGALRDQLDKGMQLGPQALRAGEFAELVCELTGMERAYICNTGTEAVFTALRLARLVTGRTKVALFSGSYHGHSDIVLGEPRGGNADPVGQPMIPGITDGATADLLVLNYGDPDSLHVLRAHGEHLAAVLVEPVQSRRPDFQPREFLHQLRQLTTEVGAALIFDEMITGFRIAPGGAQQYFKVRADLATYGKVAGGGMPLGVVAGSARFLDGIDGGFWEYGDTSYPRCETTFVAGTFNKNPLSITAAHAALAEIRRRGPELQNQLNIKTSRLVERLNTFFVAENAPIRVVYFGSLFRFKFTGNMDLFFYHLLDRGIYVWEGRNCILSDAHTDQDIDAIVQAVQDSVRALRGGGYIGDPGRVQNTTTGGAPAAALPPTSPGSVCHVGFNKPPPPASGPGGDQSAASHETKNFWQRERRASGSPSVVIRERSAVASNGRRRAMQFSLYFFGIYDSQFDRDKYCLLFEGARYADANGFSAVWVPERHFHEFGGLSPNPSVLCAALARETRRIHLRAGSVVLPLHHPIRAAEEWAVVDNISGGRVGIAFASGWNSADFVLAPDNFGNHRDVMFAGIEQVHKLWRGDSVTSKGGNGNEVCVRLFPMPMQTQLPTWLTIVNNPETFAKAGELGVGVLTNLMAQNVDRLADNLRTYRQALADHGHDPAGGHVTLLMHTFVGSDLKQTIELARQPFKRYLRSSVGLFRSMAKSQNDAVDFDSLTEDDKDLIFERAYESYVQSTALVGTPDSCSRVVEELKAIGVDEIACLIDFGLDAAAVLNSLPVLTELKNRHCRQTDSDSHAAAPSAREISARMPGDAERTVPLTEAQKQLVLLAQMNPEGSVAYNEPVVLKLTGRLRMDALRCAVQLLVDRHEALRSRIRAQDNVLIIASHLKIEVPVVDFSEFPGDEKEASVARWFNTQSQSPFDLELGPLLKVVVVKLSEERHHLYLSAHHTVIDGAAISLLLGELGTLYSSEVSGVAPTLPHAIQISDYQSWLERLIETKEWQIQKNFWLNQMSASNPALELPADHPRPPRKTYRGKRMTAALDPHLYAAIERIGQRENCTLFMTLFAAYTVLLHRLADQQEIVVGVPALGRSLPGADSLVAYCAHILPIRSDMHSGPRFTDHLRTIRGTLLDAYENQNFPFANYLSSLDIPHDPSRAPLVDSIFNLDGTLPVPKMDGLTVAYHDQPVCSARFDIGLSGVEIDNRLVLYCDYNMDLFQAETIRRLLDGFQSLLEAIVRSPDKTVFELPLLSAVQRAHLLTGFNAPSHQVPECRHQAIHQYFEAEVIRTPDSTAVVFPTTGTAACESLTYSQLNERANQLAHYLRQSGLAAEDLVGIYLDRSVDMVVAVLGILKAGGAYLPLDPDYPRSRIDFILKDAAARFIVTKQALRDELAEVEEDTICVDSQAYEILQQPKSNLAYSATGDHLAYVIYTSGSTGSPNGVSITHRNVTRLFTATADWFGFNASDVWTLFHSLAFDFSVWELWGALGHGGKLIIVAHEVSRTPSAFYKLLTNERVTVLSQTPSAFRQLIQFEQSSATAADLALRLVIFGGEALEPAMLKPWIQLHGDQHPQLVNMYGITETTVHVSYRPIGKADLGCGRSVIGRPIPDLQIYILNDFGEPVPIGVRGEIHVAGAGVARGYIHRPDLTSERFLANPFASDRRDRLYRTGDLGRYLSNGDIEYLGRRDQQVKVRGFRIELGEVESALASHPAVAETVVVADDDPQGNKRLIAYIVTPRGEEKPSTSGLRAHLRLNLPEYMIPAAFIQVESIPLTAHGKIDRRALPAPEMDGSRDDDYVAPRTATEEVLARIWSDVLSVRRVGVDDNFFDLGGHSLLASQLLTQIRQAFRMELSLTQFFEAQTVAELARRLTELEKMPGQVEKIAGLRRRVQAMSADEVAHATARHNTQPQPQRVKV